MLQDMVHDPLGRLGDAPLQLGIRQKVVRDAEDKEVADDLVRAGVAFPVVLAVGGPVPFATVGHRVAFAQNGARREAAPAGDFLEEKNGLDGFSGVGQCCG